MLRLEITGTKWYTEVDVLSMDLTRDEVSGVNHGKMCRAWVWIGSCNLGALHMKAREWMLVDVAFLRLFLVIPH